MLTNITQLFRNWWHFAVRGGLAILFGVVALIWPETTKLGLVLMFGAFAMTDGIFAVATGIAAREYFERWWAILLEGIAGILIGVLTFFLPNITALVLLYFIAAWAVTTGIFEIVAAIQFRKVISGEWAIVISGLMSVLFGILLFVFPAAGAVSLVWLIGMYAIAFGIMTLVFAFRLRSLSRNLKTVGVPA
jgi:uncharacterized membrane protein HdeD (DUF308 family)